MKIATLILAFAFVSPAALAADQEWDYQLSGVSPASGTQRPTSGKNIAELNQSKDGSYEFRIRGNTAPSCYKSFRTTQVDKPRWPPQTAPLMAGQTAPGRTVGL